MDAGRDKKRTIVDVDRLSSLPDDLIHKILSFVGIKTAIEMSALSSRWRFIWTSMPYLDFSSEHFHTLAKFSKFVTHVLSHRNNQVEVSSVKLSFRGKATHGFVKRILNYAFSHNIQQLTVASVDHRKVIEFPLSLLSSQSLKLLTLSGVKLSQPNMMLTSTWELPTLTTLYLNRIIWLNENIDLFSNCASLKSLTLYCCRTMGLNGFNICHYQLCNLTLECMRCNVNVEAPQLKNLIIRQAGCLRSLQFSAESVRSTEEVHLCIFSPYKKEAAHKIVGLLQRLHNVKFLTLNLEMVELLSSSVELMSCQPCPFANLKSLKIYPLTELLEDEAPKQVNMSTEVKNYLLYKSPNATFTMVSREEIRAMKNNKLAQSLMKSLRVRLEHEKAKTKNNRAHLEHGKTQVNNQLQIGGSVNNVDSWKDLKVQIKQVKAKTSDIISELKDIKRLLTKLPTLKRAELQTCFSSLCVEADTIVNNMIDNMKIQCDMKGSCFSVYFHELASTSQPSS